MNDLSVILGPQGPFSKVLENFRSRPAQHQMCAKIDQVINDDGGVFIAESPTGTGKTLAYLVPVVNCDKKAIISTATRHLQDQIFEKDLPLVINTLKQKKRVCLLKGRANYLCLHRLHTQASIEAANNSRYDRIYQSVCEWSLRTQSGDINDLQDLEENSPLRPLITSTSENCLGGECSHFDDCYVKRARVKAMEADIVVVNHYLYLANLILKQDGFGQLLPKAQVLIFDEAHSLPQIASTQLSRSLSSRQLMQLVVDLKSLLISNKQIIDQLFEQVENLELKLNSASQCFKRLEKIECSEYLKNPQTLDTFKQLLDQLDALTISLESRCDDKDFELLHVRAKMASEFLGECIFNEHQADKYFCWIDAGPSRYRINLTPIELTEFGHALTHSESTSCILVSATLSAAGDFSYFKNQLGFDDVRSQHWQSPYDYESQARLYLPRDLPEPWQPQFSESLLEQAIKLIELFKGRTFFLFTSHAAMEAANLRLTKRIKYPVLKQGQKPKLELIDNFKALNNAVLLGTSSFWEGVDVKGSSLSCVIIDKLPFASPDDPVLKARLKRIEQEGRNPFMHYQVPQMIISLKQGIGRLIRDEADSGVIMIGDARLLTKAYGRKVIKSLPQIPVIRDWEEVEQFVDTI